ncbi:unnamed protein product [Medioppia subpectinata]|uniref:Uncharacterized protein n=1 Tax=Medioppia subpectinata TaxID=1979941 RepID=A0A7R9KYG6_9ACAR|nr:unnamed protein product [Medioppia subpectinata]CAG2111861.1 unnamed protein product [Medioppia subpectinata]
MTALSKYIRAGSFGSLIFTLWLANCVFWIQLFGNEFLSNLANPPLRSINSVKDIGPGITHPTRTQISQTIALQIQLNRSINAIKHIPKQVIVTYMVMTNIKRHIKRVLIEFVAINGACAQRYSGKLSYVCERVGGDVVNLAICIFTGRLGVDNFYHGQCRPGGAPNGCEKVGPLNDIVVKVAADVEVADRVAGKSIRVNCFELVRASEFDLGELDIAERPCWYFCQLRVGDVLAQVLKVLAQIERLGAVAHHVSAE